MKSEKWIKSWLSRKLISFQCKVKKPNGHGHKKTVTSLNNELKEIQQQLELYVAEWLMQI